MKLPLKGAPGSPRSSQAWKGQGQSLMLSWFGSLVPFSVLSIPDLPPSFR